MQIIRFNGCCSYPNVSLVIELVGPRSIYAFEIHPVCSCSKAGNARALLAWNNTTVCPTVGWSGHCAQSARHKTQKRFKVKQASTEVEGQMRSKLRCNRMRQEIEMTGALTMHGEYIHVADKVETFRMD
mmetsp:Transcript_2671/g.4775  ORF Transcript_2671/g.4775 Transcript_2671/m.4775 type:complete len:129 (+) Transcript_2671:2302-2688(+)